jgi:hypothetical protein
MAHSFSELRSKMALERRAQNAAEARSHPRRHDAPSRSKGWGSEPLLDAPTSAPAWHGKLNVSPGWHHVGRSAPVDADPSHVVARRPRSGHSVTKSVLVRQMAHRPVAQARESG